MSAETIETHDPAPAIAAATARAEVAIRAGGTVLELRPDQQWWTPRQIATLRTLGVKDDVLPEELAIFQHVAQRSRLDPFAKQIYLIGRWDKRARRNVYRPQTGIDGYRLIAQRSGRYAGRVGPLWCGEDGQWRDTWFGSTPPAAAKMATRHYDDHGALHETWATVMFGEFVVTDKDGVRTGKWLTMPANQVAKCAEAAALRVVFPDETAGVLVDEETERDDEIARREHAAELAAAAARKAAVEHERLVAQINGAPAQPAERGKGLAPDDHGFGLPEFNAPTAEALEAFVADDAARAEAEGAPAPDAALLEVLLTAVETAEDDAQLREAESSVSAAHGVQRITDRGRQLLTDAATARRAVLRGGLEAGAE